MHLDLLAVLGQGPETALPENLNLLVGLILGLPLLGFLLNGALSLWRPRAKAAVSIIGAGTPRRIRHALVAFRQLAPVWQADPEAAPIISFWSWLPVGDLKVNFSFLLDHLSMVMLLVVTGVGSLIHLFSIGYMKADDGTRGTSRTSTSLSHSCWFWCSAPASR
jgi:NADH-quinone oxidoreductase subunit L